MLSARFIALALACAVGIGCAGYRLGPTNGMAAGSKSITLQPFENATMEPRLGQAVSTALRKTIQRDGTYRLETREKGDILVQGKIVAYNRTPLTFSPTDVVTARDYELRILARVTAINTATGEQILAQDVGGRTTLRLADNAASVERQAAPLLAEDLARNITALLVDGSW